MERVYGRQSFRWLINHDTFPFPSLRHEWFPFIPLPRLQFYFLSSTSDVLYPHQLLLFLFFSSLPFFPLCQSYYFSYFSRLYFLESTSFLQITPHCFYYQYLLPPYPKEDRIVSPSFPPSGLIYDRLYFFRLLFNFLYEDHHALYFFCIFFPPEIY